MLKIPELEASEQDLKQLERLSKLDVLELPYCKVGAKAILGLKRLVKLRKIALDGVTGLSPVLVALRSSKYLTDLSVTSAKLGDEDLKAIGEIENLDILNCGDNQFGSEGVQYLTKLPRLRFLRIVSNKIFDCDTFEGFKHLKELRLSQTDWSPVDKSRLEKKLGSRVVIWTGLDGTGREG